MVGLAVRIVGSGDDADGDGGGGAVMATEVMWEVVVVGHGWCGSVIVEWVEQT